MFLNFVIHCSNLLQFVIFQSYKVVYYGEQYFQFSFFSITVQSIQLALGLKHILFGLRINTNQKSIIIMSIIV